MHIDSYKPAKKPAAYGANNHGSIVEINGEWYIFYHRHTNNTWYCRQGCAEKIEFTKDGQIIQAEITSCGLNGGPLSDKGEYPAYIACNIFNDKEDVYVGEPKTAFITQEGKDGDKEPAYISNINDGTTIGFKYFDLKGVKGFKLTSRGYGQGRFEIRTSLDGNVLGEIECGFCTVWETASTDIDIADGVYPIYLTFKGQGNPSVLSFEFLH